MAETKAVELTAEVRQVKSMADHTYNLTLNVPEYCLPQVQQIMAWLTDEVRIVMVQTGTEHDESGRKPKF